MKSIVTKEVKVCGKICIDYVWHVLIYIRFYFTKKNWMVLSRFFDENFVKANTAQGVAQCGKMNNLSTLLKTVTITKFLPKMREREFP